MIITFSGVSSAGEYGEVANLAITSVANGPLQHDRTGWARAT